MSRKKKGLAIALTAIMVLSVFAVAPATADASTQSYDLTVDDNNDYNDDNDNDNQYHTIQAAVNDADPGDSIGVASGHYEERVVVNKSVVIEGAGADSTSLQGDEPTEETLILGADNVEFRGFTVSVPGQDSDEEAIKIHDEIDQSHVVNVLVEDNVFVGNDDTFRLGMATPDESNQVARALRIQDNEFTGGTVGSMDIGFHLNAKNSTMDDNTFSTKASKASLKVSGEENTITETTIEYPGYGWSGMWITEDAKDNQVDDLTVDGHLDEHKYHDEDRGDWLKFGVVVEGDRSTLSNVDVHETHIGIMVGDDYDGIGVEDVALLDSSGEENRNHDLKIESAKNVHVNNFDAMSTVRPEEDEWSDFTGDHPTSGANVFVLDGEDHRLGNVTSTSPSPIGIAMHDVDDTVIDNAEIANKVGGKVDLSGGLEKTTGITLSNSNDNTIQNSLVENNNRGVAITDGDDNALVGNNPGIYNNTNEGVLLDDADDTKLKDNDVRGNGVGLRAFDDSDNTRAKYNNFVGNGDGIVVSSDSDVDARWNWFGADNGPSGPATDGVLSGDGDSIVGDDLEYDPFLTDTKDNVTQDPAKTQQYAHDFVTHGSQGVQTVASPGPADVQFQFSSGSNAMVWTYDGSFNQVMSANTQADTLEGYIITNLNAGENARVVVDFSDTNVATPGSASLDSGWNFVAAPQYGDTEDVMRSTTEILRVAHGYDQFDSQPYPQGDASAFAYPMGSDSDGPRLSAFTGYWVYVDGSGELTAAIPAGVTLTEEPGLIQDS